MCSVGTGTGYGVLEGFGIENVGKGKQRAFVNGQIKTINRGWLVVCISEGRVEAVHVGEELIHISFCVCPDKNINISW